MDANIKVLTEDEVKQYNYLPVKHYVYLITNLLNGFIYVGYRHTKNEILLDDYWGSGVLIIKAIKEFGKKNFKKDIIAVFNNDKDAYRLEREIVSIDFIKRDDVYNQAVGGHGGPTNIGKKFSDEHKRKIGAKHKNKVTSEETKQKIRESKKDKENGRVWIKNESTGETRWLHPNTEVYNSLIASGEWTFGRGSLALSDDAKEKRRQVQIGRWLDYVTLKNVKTQIIRRVKRNSDEYFNLLSIGFIEYSACKDCIWLINEKLQKMKRAIKNSEKYFNLIAEGYIEGFKRF